MAANDIGVGLAALIPAARVADHDDARIQPRLLASRRVPWPEGRMELCCLGALTVGMVIAPVRWELAYLAGTAGLPWAFVVREPFTLKALQVGASSWGYETRVPCQLPSGEELYYLGSPMDVVRIVEPEQVGGRLE